MRRASIASDDLPGATEPGLTRRAMLALGAVGVSASTAPALAAETRLGRIVETLETFHGFGVKASGGAGDNACGAWIERNLRTAGYAVSRQVIEVPAFEGPQATLECDGRSAEVIPQAIVVPTGPGGLEAPLYVAGQGGPSGGIAMIVLPYARRSSIDDAIETKVKREIARGARAAILVTTGPTNDACALNVRDGPPLFPLPVAILAPRDAGPYLEAAGKGRPARLRMPGRAFRREAFNVVATLDRGKARTLVVSTSRSGWFGCMAERGPGLAAWLEIARWAAGRSLPVNVALVCATAHEYEQPGGEAYIRHLAPPPAKTALWLHLGANLAAPDWHERKGELFRLDAADPQRFLVASPAMLERARRAFRGLPGLENVYPARAEWVGGETQGVLKAGYDPVVGQFGNNRFHHTGSDDLRCAAPQLVEPVVRAYEALLADLFIDANAGSEGLSTP